MEKLGRNLKILKLREDGETFANIGKIVGLHPTCVRGVCLRKDRIVKKFFLMTLFKSTLHIDDPNKFLTSDELIKYDPNINLSNDDYSIDHGCLPSECRINLSPNIGEKINAIFND